MEQAHYSFSFSSLSLFDYFNKKHVLVFFVLKLQEAQLSNVKGLPINIVKMVNNYIIHDLLK